jgi:hypothetical protein
VSQERPEERFAFAVVGSVLPGTIEPYDRGGRQRAVDAILTTPTGERLHSKSRPLGQTMKPRSLTISATGATVRALLG